MTIIVKASGEHEEFSEDKLRSSLQRSLASPETIEEIVKHIKKELVDNMSTHQIYRHAFSLLKKKSPPLAGRYHLKRAIMELGPSGYLFEKFIGEVLKAKGFTVEIGRIVKGYCVDHEIDIVAEKQEKHIMVECKFHNSQGIKSDVKIALYVKARFDDVEKKWHKQKDPIQKFHEAWLVTNTKLTWDAIRYARCIGMKAIGWNYPAEESLQKIIEQSGRHPITCLTTLSGSQKRLLLNKNVLLCRDLIVKENLLKSAGIGNATISKVITEIKELCGM